MDRLPQVSNDLQRQRDIDAARVRFSEINQDPDREQEIARDMAGNFSAATQRAAQSGNNLPSVQDANAQHATQGNTEDLPSVQEANQQHSQGFWSKVGDKAGELGKDAAGGNLAVAKTLLSIPGYVGGAVNALSGMARGDKPSEALEGMSGAAQDFGDKAFNSILNMLPSGVAKKLYELDQNAGSKAVSEFLGQMFDFGPIGQGYGNIAALLKAKPELAKQIDAGMQLAMNMGMLAGNPKFGKGGKPTAGEITEARQRQGYDDKTEPTLNAPQVDVTGKAEPKLNDYEQLGIDANEGPQMGQTPNLRNPQGQEPTMGAEPDVSGFDRNKNIDPTVPATPAQTQYTFKGYQGGMPFEKSTIEAQTPDPYNYKNPIPVTRGDFPSMQLPEDARTRSSPEQVPFDPETARSPRMQPEEPLDYPKDKEDVHSVESDADAARTAREVSSRNAGESQATFVHWVETLPEKVTKDNVVARHIKRIREQMDYLNTKLAEYRQGALDATRVRDGEVGRTKQSQKKGGDLDRLEKQIQNEQTLLENMGSQLYERLQSKHPYQEPWFPQKEGEFGKVNKGASSEDVPPKSTYQTGNPPAGIKHSSSPEGFRGQSSTSSGHPFAKGQSGALNLKEIAEGFGDLGRRLKGAFKAAADAPPRRLGQTDEHFGEAIRRGVDAFTAEKPTPEVFRPINRGPGGKQSGGMDPKVFGEGLSKLLGRGKSPAEMRKGLGYNDPTPGTAGANTWHQFDSWHTTTAADAIREAEKRGPLQDISPNREMAIKNLFSGKTAAIFTEHIPGSGEVIKWMNDKIRYLDRASENLTKEILGYKFEVTGKLKRWKTMVKDPNGIFSVWDHHTTSAEDIAGMHGTALKSMFDLKEPTQKDFSNDKQFKMYSAIREGLNKTLDLVNDVRKAIGMPEIQKIPGFLPTMIRGGYRLIGKDASGATKFLIGTEVRGAINKWVVGGMSFFTERPLALKEVQAHMEKMHPDLKFSEIDLSHGDKTKLGDLSAFEEIARTLSKDDPLAKAAHQTYIKLLTSRGFGSHSLQRKGGWEGFQGSGNGYKAARDMRNSIETYINQAMQYRSNILKQGAYRELMESKGVKWHTQADEMGNSTSIPSPNLIQEIPHTMSYIKDYMDHSMNKDLNAWDYLDSAILQLSHNYGFGKHYPTQIVNKLGNFASMLWLTTPRFIMSQGLQHLNFAPQMLKQLGEGAMENGVTSWAKGWKQFVMPDVMAKDAISWAAEHGYLDKKIINAFDSGYDVGSQFGHIKDTADAVKFTKELLPKLSKYTLGTVEQQLVRIPTFLWAEQALRSTIKDDAARFGRAAEMVDHYMVNYTKSERPMIYNRLGLGGVLLGKLKSYSHNFYGQAFEYLGDLKRDDPKSFAPMTAFLANNFFQAGIKGLIGFELINGAMNVVNWASNTAYPTGEELLYSSGMSDTFIFGGASKLTGLLMNHAYDFSGSTSAPSLASMASIPAGSMALSMAQGGKTILDMVKGEATPGEKLQALKENLPTWAAGIVEKLYSYDGKMVPRASRDGDITTDYSRDTEEWLVRMMIGTRSLDEAAKSASMSLRNRQIAKDDEVANRMMSVMYEQWKSGKGIDPDTLNKFMFSEMKDQQGNPVVRSSPEKLETALVDKLKKEIFTRAQNMLIKSQPNLSSAESIQRLQQFRQFGLDKMSPQESLDLHQQMKQQGF